MPKAVLSGLKRKDVKISVICAMLDSGGSSGRLREDYGIRAPGDLRRALIALANTSPALEELFNFRFEVGELKGHNFANLLITALELSTNNYEEAVTELKKLLRIEHEVFPVTLGRSEVCARLENGRVVRGETNIDRPKHNPSLAIKEIFLEPEVEAYPPALRAIREADLVVVGPGDLYSSLAQVLLVEGVSEAVGESEGKIVYLVNLMTKKGETDGFSVARFTKEIENLLGREVDFALYSDPSFSEERVKNYKKDHPELEELVKVEDNLENSKFLKKDLAYEKGPIEHDSLKVAEALIDFLDYED